LFLKKVNAVITICYLVIGTHRTPTDVFNCLANLSATGYNKPGIPEQASKCVDVRFPTRNGCTCCKRLDHNCDSDASAHKEWI